MKLDDIKKLQQKKYRAEFGHFLVEGEHLDLLGIRPEHLALTHGTPHEAGHIPGRVSHVEKLGGETLVYVHSEDHGLLTVRLFGEQDYAVDEAVGLRLDAGRLFHFDAQGQRLR